MNSSDAHVLRWPGKLLSADDLRRHLRGQRELIVQRRAIVTPLAIDELKDRKVRLIRDDAVQETSAKSTVAIGIAEEKPCPLVAAALRSLEREGINLRPVPACSTTLLKWAQSLADSVAKGDCRSCVAFCGDPGLVCCLANKKPGVRAAAAMTVAQTARAISSLGANLIAVEMPGRTLFEVRQIVATVYQARGSCPGEVAENLRELDGHAHR